MTYDSPEGWRTTMRLDARGRVVEARIPGLEPLLSAYDARGRVDAVTFGDGADALFFDGQRWNDFRPPGVSSREHAVLTDIQHTDRDTS